MVTLQKIEALDSLTIVTMLKVVLLSSFLVSGASRPYPYRPFGVRRTPVGDLSHLVEFGRPMHAWSGFRYEETVDEHTKSQLGMRSQGRQPKAVESSASNEPKLWLLCRNMAERHPSISDSVYRRNSFASSLHGIIQTLLCISFLWLSFQLGTQPITFWLLMEVIALSVAVTILSAIVAFQYLNLWHVGIENKQKKEIRDSDGCRWSGEIIAPRQMEMKYPSRFPRLAKAFYKLSSERASIYSGIRDCIPPLLFVSGTLSVVVLAWMLIDSLDTEVFLAIDVLLKRIGLRIVKADVLFDTIVITVRKDLIWIGCGSFLVLCLFVDPWHIEALTKG